MYATCLFCNKALGSNETLETFPVGRRLAFDAAKGRLWVVCPHCERWNLSPLEERWEAIETAERLFRDTRRRVSTDNVGLAKLRDGTTLVRIGQPLRPEFAAWRYGDQFGRRRRRQLLIAGGAVVGVGGIVALGAYAGVIGGIGWIAMRAAGMAINGNPEAVVAKINTSQTGVVHVRRRHLGETALGRGADGGLAIDLRFKNGQAHFEGREAQRIASIVIPKVNRFGGNKKAIADAVGEIERAGSADAFMDRLMKSTHIYTRPREPGRRWGRDSMSTSFIRHGLYGLPGEYRLALEMALHEEAERRAFEGELADLERAWQEAEEIAAISDNLFVPPNVTQSLERLRQS
ncbi:MAG TPA: hypothetical protein VL157_08190 [Gemmatimonadaceae bacterium]|jgi:hypothetical protein|nr:hypothetical protein [Gemmatimonadaceae bacterium]